MTPPGFHVLPLPLVQLSLAAVLKCGQSFRWSTFPLPAESPAAPTHEYRLCLRDRLVCLRQSPDTLFYRAVFPDPQPTPTQHPLRDAETLVWLNDYFQLNIDLEKLYQQWAAQDKVFARFQARFGGIRILRQDPWENLISFICSSNNNISRITKMVQGLCKQYSPSLLSHPDPTAPLEQQAYYPFPPPSVLARPDVGATLRTLGFGYRAEFIQRTAKMLVDAHGTSCLPNDLTEESERWLIGLRSRSTSEAREELLKFIGVGRKVADCVLLMSLDKNEVVPVDTHVHQIAVKHYGMKGSSGGKTNMTPKLYDELSTKLSSVWGEYAGWAHTVLFTADLKSFSSYGLTLESPAPKSQPATPRKRGPATKLVLDPKLALPTPPLTPMVELEASPLKRKDREPELVLPTPVLQDVDLASESLSLAERVKKRRRVTRIAGGPV